MANSIIPVPFIKLKEGGLSRNPNDTASQNPCPYPYNGVYGYHTNRGITWKNFSFMFGNTLAIANRFFAMDDEDWNAIYKPGFWDIMHGDQINSQRIANLIADWLWMSWKIAEIDVQDAINHVFKQHLTEDGNFGPETIKSINSVDEPTLYQSIINRHKQFYTDLIATKNSKGDHTQDGFLTGWLSRIDAMVTFNANGYKL